MSAYQVIQQYPSSAAQVWRVLTEPALVARWTVTGRGGRLVGFDPRVGTRFQLIGKPVPGWNGVVDCEVLELRPLELLRYSWQGAPNETPSEVAFRLEQRGEGTRLICDHTGFTGLGGYFLSKVLGRVRRKMLAVGIPPVLAELDRSRA